MQKIALLGTHGLPAQHGAFEQTVFKICEWAHTHAIPAHFVVSCSAQLKNQAFSLPNTERMFTARHAGAGILLYDLVASGRAYIKGCRTFVYFGYEFAFFFLLFRLLGVNVICNVDGIEWRRQKWGRAAKTFFRCSEWIAARTANHLIFDALGIERYFGINHGAVGTRIFYGHDEPTMAGAANLPEDLGPYYSCVMRLEPENNILSIVKGFAEAETDKRLIIIGPATPFFDQNCMSFVDGCKIRYLGPIYDRARLTAIRAGSFGYLHGHSVGGTNPTLIEAISLGNSVIAYNSIFNREVCGDGALYFNHAEDLARILAEEQLPLPPILSEEYSWDHVVRAYLALCDVRVR